MAILVKVEMIDRSDVFVTYSYSNEAGSNGTFSVNSSTGALDLISGIPNDYRKMYFNRAARKVMSDWKTSGKLPIKTYWAS